MDKKSCTTKTSSDVSKLIQKPKKLTAAGYQRRYMTLTNRPSKKKSA